MLLQEMHLLGNIFGNEDGTKVQGLGIWTHIQREIWCIDTAKCIEGNGKLKGKNQNFRI